ncbi:MAG: carboxypeptidase-like regulatory domain-containing protein [Planctomycetota bacterium]
MKFFAWILLFVGAAALLVAALRVAPSEELDAPDTLARRSAAPAFRAEQELSSEDRASSQSSGYVAPRAVRDRESDVASSPPAPALRGRIVDARGRGVGGARVTVFAPGALPEVQTGADGTYRVLPPPATDSEFHVFAQHERLAPGVGPVRATRYEAGGYELDDLTLTRGGSVAFSTAAHTGAIDVHASLEPAYGEPLGRIPHAWALRARAGERVTFEHVPAGEYRLVLSGPRVARLVLDGLEVTGEGEADLGALELAPASVVEGIVLGPDGGRVPGAEVRLIGCEHGTLRTSLLSFATTDETGRFVLTGVSSDAAQIHASGAGYRSAVLPWRPGDESELRVVLHAGLNPTARVVDVTGDTVAVLGATLVREDRAASPIAGTADSEGLWTFHGCDLGEHRLLLDLGDGASHEERVHLAMSSWESPWIVTLAPRRPLTGRVIDGASGRPVVNARVAFSVNDGASAFSVTRTDAEGAFALGRRSDRKGRLAVSARGKAARVVEIDPGQRDTGTLRLEELATLRGVVAGVDTDASRDVRIVVFSRVSDVRCVDAAEDGSFVVDDVNPGDVHAYAFEGDLKEFLASGIPWFFADSTAWPPAPHVCAPGSDTHVRLELTGRPLGAYAADILIDGADGIARVAGSLRPCGRAGTPGERFVEALDGDGRACFEWTGVAAGVYQLTVSTVGAQKRPLLSERVELTGAAGQREQFRVAVCALTVDVDGFASIEGRTTLVVTPEGGAPVRRLVTGPSLRVSGLPAGSAEVALERSGAAPLIAEIELVPASPNTVGFRID